MADPLPPLPYRPLDVRGHGVYDPATGRFFPFRVWSSGDSLAGKNGISYYIRSANVYAMNYGDAAGGYLQLQGIVGGSTVPFIYAYVSATTAASGVNQHNQSELLIDLLLDPGTSVTRTKTCSGGGHVMIYAEIPVDGGEIA